MEETENFKLPLLIPNQSQKEITHNEALIILDAIVNRGVLDFIDTPPENPNINDIYIVGKNPEGLFLNRENFITFFNNGWRFIEPKIGFFTLVNSNNSFYLFKGNIWEEIEPLGGLNSFEKIGINSTADTENKLTVKSDYVLFDNNGSNSRIKVNKSDDSCIASHLFQNNYVGKAEFGLIGDDNFTLKVSNDGDNWNESFKVDSTTGNVDFKKLITRNGEPIAMPYPSNISGSVGFIMLMQGEIGEDLYLPNIGTWAILTTWSTEGSTAISYNFSYDSYFNYGVLAGGTAIKRGRTGHAQMAYVIRIQ